MIPLMIVALVLLLGAWIFWCASDALEELARKVLIGAWVFAAAVLVFVSVVAL